MAVPVTFPSREQLDRWYSSPAAYMAAVDYSGGDVEYTGRIPVALFAQTAGAIKFDGLPTGTGDVTTVTITVPAGQILPVLVTKVWQTGTDVTLFAFFK
jgi:hypothetical protein